VCCGANNITHQLQPTRAIPAHAGKDRANRHRADGLRYGLEQHVDARTVARGQLVLRHPALELTRAALDAQVEELAARWSDICNRS